MSGIVFFATRRLSTVASFYTDEVGADVWLEQEGCTVLRQGNFLFGFCDRDEADTCGTVTFYYDDRDAVDELYDRLADRARAPPRENEQYEIYQFFADDPEGRTVEFQSFLHPTPEV